MNFAMGQTAYATKKVFAIGHTAHGMTITQDARGFTVTERSGKTHRFANEQQLTAWLDAHQEQQTAQR